VLSVDIVTVVQSVSHDAVVSVLLSSN